VPGVKLSPGGKLPPGAKLPRVRTPGIIRNNGSGIPSALLGDLLKPVNLVVLRNNAFLEAVVIAAVVIIDAGYRRLRRARRARTSLAPAPALPIFTDILPNPRSGQENPFCLLL
jgi:hypothetical protein